MFTSRTILVVFVLYVVTSDADEIAITRISGQSTHHHTLNMFIGGNWRLERLFMANGSENRS